MSTNSSGLTVTKDDVNTVVGAMCRDLIRVLDRAKALKTWKTTFPTFGNDLLFTPADATDISNAIDDVDYLATIAGLANIRKVAGLGNV